MKLSPSLGWLRPPTFPDPAKTQQATMVWGLLWALLVTSLPILFVVRFGGSSFVSLMAGNLIMVGLAIARTLIEAHDGTLTLTSALGEGAVYTAALPIASTLLKAQLESLERLA